MSDLQRGDAVWVTVLKANGNLHRRWEARIEEASCDLLVAVTCVGNTVWLYSHSYPQRYYIRSYYWLDRPYTISEFYNPDSTLALVYSDICSPVALRDGEVCFIDHELDVAYWTDQTAEIVDEDEFAEAIVKYGYPAELQEQCYKAAAEALEVVRAWRPKGFTDDFRLCP